MANNRINRYISAIALGMVLIVVPSCTDTWDDHYNYDPSPETTQTLWDVIKDNPNYSRFADIVKHAKYYKDETHEVSSYTYEDILNGSQVNTVWIPDNSVLTEEEYQKWMSMLGESRADDNAKLGYNVQQQFLGNHIALWRHNVSEPGMDTVKMVNGKNLEFDKTNLTFAGVPLSKYNIPSVNGVVHVLQGIAPFHYNFYEYLKFAEQKTKLGKYVVSKDTTYFRSSESIEGLPDENGNPTYVDSAYSTSNRLFETTYYLPRERAEEWQMADKGFGARINNEDSLFVMIMPTDDAWDAAYENLKASHTYATQYENNEKGDQNASASDKKITGLNPDSLQKMSIEMDLVSPLVYVLRKQPKRDKAQIWTKELFKQYKGNGSDPDSPDEYLLNTFNDTLRNIPQGVWDKSSLFGNVEPKEMSNGLAYEVDSWNFPSQYYTPDVEVELEWGMFYNQQGSDFKLGSQSGKVSFSNSMYQEVAEKYGRVSNNNFFLFDKPTSGNAKARIKLKGNSPTAYVPEAEVMSGKYDIQIVMVPLWYTEVPDGYIDFSDEAKRDSAASVNMTKFKVKIYYNDNKTADSNEAFKDGKSTFFTYYAQKVDTITVATDFEFKYSYKNMRYCYPQLYIEGATGASDLKKGYKYNFAIDKIILKRKD